jgi:hypothetical protein
MWLKPVVNPSKSVQAFTKARSEVKSLSSRGVTTPAKRENYTYKVDGSGFTEKTIRLFRSATTLRAGRQSFVNFF